MPLKPATLKNYDRQIQLMTREAIKKRSDGAEDHIPELTFIDLAQDLLENPNQTKVTTHQIRRSALIWKMTELRIDENQVRAVLELLDPLTKIKNKKEKWCSWFDKQQKAGAHDSISRLCQI